MTFKYFKFQMSFEIKIREKIHFDWKKMWKTKRKNILSIYMSLFKKDIVCVFPMEVKTKYFFFIIIMLLLLKLYVSWNQTVSFLDLCLKVAFVFLEWVKENFSVTAFIIIFKLLKKKAFFKNGSKGNFDLKTSTY